MVCLERTDVSVAEVWSHSHLSTSLTLTSLEASINLNLALLAASSKSIASYLTGLSAEGLYPQCEAVLVFPEATKACFTGLEGLLREGQCHVEGGGRLEELCAFLESIGIEGLEAFEEGTAGQLM